MPTAQVCALGNLVICILAVLGQNLLLHVLYDIYFRLEWNGILRVLILTLFYPELPILCGCGPSHSVLAHLASVDPPDAL